MARINGYIHTLSIEELTEVSTNLRAIGNCETEPYDLSRGICNHLNNAFDYWMDDYDIASGVVTELAQSWSKFSGNDSYPVPSTFGEQRPSEAYNFHFDIWQNQWKDNTYGNLRRELCIHMADEIDKIIATKQESQGNEH